ncbi:MAG: universal stress protein, partial [Anaerolineae bacterium]|nr:universal stress protein [Anaerolineae bacterium]
MSRSPTSLATIQRILVAVDGSDHSLAALETACSLAAQLHAELEALFVEDDDLLRLADLPCARVVSTLLLESEPTDRERMERMLRLLADRAQDALQRHAVALGVRARFRAVRGRVVAEVQAAAGE